MPINPAIDTLPGCSGKHLGARDPACVHFILQRVVD